MESNVGKLTSISQLDFSHGELNKRFYGNFASEYYKTSAKQIVNMDITPNGAIVSRPGTTCCYSSTVLPQTASWGERVIVFSPTKILIFSSLFPYGKSEINYPSELSGGLVGVENIFTIESTSLGILIYVPKTTGNPQGGVVKITQASNGTYSSTYTPVVYTKSAPSIPDLDIKAFIFFESRSAILSGDSIFLSSTTVPFTFSDVVGTTLAGPLKYTLGIPVLENETLLSCVYTQRFIAVMSTNAYYWMIFNDQAIDSSTLFSIIKVTHNKSNYGCTYSQNGKVYCVGDTFVQSLEYSDLDKQLMATDLTMYCQHVHESQVVHSKKRVGNGFFTISLLRADGIIYNLVLNVNNKTVPAAASRYMLLRSNIVCKEVAKYVDITNDTISYTSYINGKYYVEIENPRRLVYNALNHDGRYAEYGTLDSHEKYLENTDWLERSVVNSTMCDILCEVLSPTTMRIVEINSISPPLATISVGDVLEINILIQSEVIGITAFAKDGIITLKNGVTPPLDMTAQYYRINGVLKPNLPSQEQIDLLSGLEDLCVKVYFAGKSIIRPWPSPTNTIYPHGICAKFGQCTRSYINFLLGDPIKSYSIQSCKVLFNNTVCAGVYTTSISEQGEIPPSFSQYINDVQDWNLKLNNPSDFKNFKLIKSPDIQPRVNWYNVDLNFSSPVLNLNKTLYISSCSGYNLEVLGISSMLSNVSAH